MGLLTVWKRTKEKLIVVKKINKNWNYSWKWKRYKIIDNSLKII